MKVRNCKVTFWTKKVNTGKVFETKIYFLTSEEMLLYLNEIMKLHNFVSLEWSD